MKLSVEGSELDGIVLYDFSGYSAFLTCYVPGKENNLTFFLSLLNNLKYGNTPLQFAGGVTLSSTKEFFGELRTKKILRS